MSTRRSAGRRLRPVFAVLAAATALLAASCAGSTPGQSTTAGGLTTVRMVEEWPVADGQWIPWIVAQKEGYYTQAGINLQIIPPPNTSATAQYIGTGRADIAFDTSMDVVFARAQGVPMVSIASYGSNNNWGLISSAGHPLDLASIKGKTIGTYTDSWSQAQLQIMLQSVGLKLSDVHLVTAADDTVPLLMQNKVDAITGTTNAEGSELNSLGVSSYSMALAKDHGVPNSPVLVLAANSSWLSSNKAVAQKFMDATIKGLNYALAHPTQAVADFMAAYPKAQSLGFTTFQWKATGALFGATASESTLTQTTSQWAGLINAASTYKLVDKTEQPSAYFTNGLLGGTS